MDACGRPVAVRPGAGSGIHVGTGCGARAEGQPERGIQGVDSGAGQDERRRCPKLFLAPRVAGLQQQQAGELRRRGQHGRSVQPLMVARPPGGPVAVRRLRAPEQSGQVASFRGHGGSQTPAGQAGADRQRAASVSPVAQGPRGLEKRRGIHYPH